MGSQMSSKYSGKCNLCEKSWNVGEQMFYQKDPKCMCIDKECFEKQGGKIFEKSFGGNSFSKQVSKIDISSVNVPDLAKLQTQAVKNAQREMSEFKFFRDEILRLGGNEIQAGMLFKTMCDRTR